MLPGDTKDQKEQSILGLDIYEITKGRCDYYSISRKKKKTKGGELC
jgi:hypothetical protein